MTEEEIYNGILRAAKPETECFWFKRNIVDLSQYTEQKTCGRYMDVTNKKVDEQAQELLGKLR